MLVGLPALALVQVNRNALTKAPVMSKEFSRPPAKEDPKTAAEAEKAADAQKAPVMKAPLTAPDGVELPRIVASVYNFSDGSIGMYQLPDVSGGEMTKLSDTASSFYGGAAKDGIYYACDDGRFEDYWDTDSDPHGHRIQAYDMSSWEAVGSPITLASYRANDLAISPVDGLGYAFCDYGSMMFHLFKINLQTGESEEINPSSSLFGDETTMAVAFNEDGVLYGVTKGGKFGVVDTTTGKNAATYDLGLNTSWSSQYNNYSMCLDPDSGNFLFLFNGSEDWGSTRESRLYSINPKNGTTTLLATWTGYSITSPAIAVDPIADGAPGEATGLTATFGQGELSGTVNFTMPATLYDGSAASGDATWTLYDGKEQIATGTAAYGTAVSTPATVAAAGKHNLIVKVSNAAGEGKSAKISLWIGPDQPSAPTGVAMVMDEANHKFTVTWLPVTTGANAGYVNPSDITYKVVRMPGEVVVAEGLTTNMFEEVYEPLSIENIHYEVYAVQKGLPSEPGISNTVTSGSLGLPYTFSETDFYTRLDNWTIIDANKDGNTWTNDSYGVSYKYHSTNNGDDWLITPPIKAYSGCKYKVKGVFAGYASYYPERVEVMYGFTNTATGMTTTVIEPTLIESSEGITLEGEIEMDRDGKFFIGVHAISDKDQFRLYMQELTISAPVSTEAPGAGEITELLADPSGALKVTGKVKAPELNANGTPCPYVSKIEIMRGDVLAATIEDLQPGQVAEFTDEAVPEKGEYSYTAYAYNGELKGAVSEPFMTYVGISEPGECSNIRISRVPDDPKQVTVTWDAPTKDWRGYPLNGSLTYQIEVYPDNALFHGNKTYTDITETSFTFTPTFETGRDHGFVFVKVSGVTEGGVGFAAESENIYAGDPLTIPFKESFPNYTLEHPWGDGESNGPQIASITDDEQAISFNQYNGWNRMMDASFNNLEGANGSQDGDNGFAGMFGWSYVEDEQGNRHNEYTDLLSPCIDLSGEENPYLTFYTYNWLQYGRKCLNTLDIDIVTEDGTRSPLYHTVIGDLSDLPGWTFVAVDLSAYKGQTVSLVFRPTIIGQDDEGYNWVLLDNIRIDKAVGVDLQVSEFSAPVQAVPNEEFKISARVDNFGVKDSPAYKATLYHNDAAIATQDMPALACAANTTVEFTSALRVKDPIGNTYKIVVEAEGDENADNNTTNSLTVARNLQLLPAPQKVFINPGGERLEWAEPDMEAAVPAAKTEDFESIPILETELFTSDVPDWIFHDVDQGLIGGMVSSSTWEVMEYPGIPTHSQQSWWVQNRAFEEFNDGYYGYDYSLQYLANMYVVNETFDTCVQQDDWAITPELCGQEQLVTLWARSYNKATPETVEFLYSEGGTNPEDFQLISRVEELSGDWTQYALVVPEGAKRFAIRGCSWAELGTAQTFIDDVRFYPAAGDKQELQLKGYNVYADDELLNAAPLTSLEMLELPEGNHEYAVSAVYESGESRAIVATEGTGLGFQPSLLKVTTRPGMIVLDGLADAEWSIVSASGMIVAKGQGENHVETAVSAGVYLVTVDSRMYKLIVK